MNTVSNDLKIRETRFMSKGSLMNAARAAGAALCIAVIGGCAFTGVRKEHSSPPTFPYANPRLQAVTHDIPVVIDSVDCVEMAMVSDRGILGGTSFLGTFPMRHIVVREFGRFVNENMRQPMEGESEKLVLKIYSKRILVEQKWSRSRCEMILDVQLLDPKSLDARPYFRSSVRGEWNGIHKDDTTVPESVYQAVGEIIRCFTENLVKDRSAMRRLSLLARPDGRVVPPTLKTIAFDQMRNNIVSGRCEVQCNGWDGFDADKWARAQINGSCQMKLGIEAERLRVVYLKDVYDSDRKTWKYEFRTFARTPIVMDYDPFTRTGICIGDLGLLNLPIKEAAFRMKDFVVNEMRAHAGAVDSAVGDRKTAVRFKDVKSDAVNNLLQIGFSLPY